MEALQFIPSGSIKRPSLRPKRYLAGLDDEGKMCVYDCMEHCFVYRNVNRQPLKVKADIEKRFGKNLSSFSSDLLRSIEEYYVKHPLISGMPSRETKQRQKVSKKKDVMVRIVNLLDYYQVGRDQVATGGRMKIEFEYNAVKNILRAHLTNEEIPKGCQCLEVDMDKGDYYYLVDGAVRQKAKFLEDLFK